MSKRLRPSGAVHWRLKANKEENLTKYVVSIYEYGKEVEQNRKSYGDKGDKQKKQDLSMTKKLKKRPLPICDSLIVIFKMF